MLDQLTERGQEVMRLAQDESLQFNHGYLGSRHILIALVRECESPAGKILRSAGVELEAVRAEVERRGGRRKSLPSKTMTYTDQYGKVAEQAVYIAASLRSLEIGPEHLLLAICRVKGGIAFRSLKELGVELSSVRRELLESIVSDATSSISAGHIPLESPDIIVQAIQLHEASLEILKAKLEQHARP